MGYSHDARRSLARIADLLEEPAASAKWSAAAASVATALERALWRPERSAFFDKDVNGDWVTTLVHNNIRLMWHGAMTQAHADAFVGTHLMNRSEFYTRMPLPSIAVSDPRFQNKRGNDWSGPPEGLTLQRAIRALEQYGHHAESVQIGIRLTAALLPRGQQGPGQGVGGNFPQSIDPFTAVPDRGDGYGPMILSLLEYTALRVGIVPRPQRGLLWTGLPQNQAHRSTYSQTLGPHTYHLTLHPNGSFVGVRDGVRLFEARGGARVVTDLLSGTVKEVWGVANTTRQVRLFVTAAGGSPELSQELQLTVAPNEEWAVSFGDTHPPSAKLIRSSPFFSPFT